MKNYIFQIELGRRVSLIYIFANLFNTRLIRIQLESH